MKPSSHLGVAWGKQRSCISIASAGQCCAVSNARHFCIRQKEVSHYASVITSRARRRLYENGATLSCHTLRLHNARGKMNGLGDEKTFSRERYRAVPDGRLGHGAGRGFMPALTGPRLLPSEVRGPRWRADSRARRDDDGRHGRRITRRGRLELLRTVFQSIFRVMPSLLESLRHTGHYGSPD